MSGRRGLAVLAQWMEVVASVAVVVSLLFLIHEVRLNTQEIRRQGVLEQAGGLATPFFESAELVDALAKVRAVDGPSPSQAAFEEVYGMTTEEALLWSRHLSQVWRGVEAEYLFGNRELALGYVWGLTQSPDNNLFLAEFMECCLNPEFAAEIRHIQETR